MDDFRFIVTLIDAPSFRVNLYVNPTPIVEDVFRAAKVLSDLELAIRRSILGLF